MSPSRKKVNPVGFLERMLALLLALTYHREVGARRVSWCLLCIRTSLPDFLDQLPDLREVDVSINSLETLPESLWRTTQLTKLNLSFNPLKVLPDGIANMKALTTLLYEAVRLKPYPIPWPVQKILPGLS
jgi:hypothetical protein